MTKGIEELLTRHFKAGYEAARSDSVKHIRHAYALGQEVGRFEKLMELHDDAEENHRDSRDTKGTCDTDVESARSEPESVDTKRPPSYGWYLHGFSQIRPGGLFNEEIVIVEDNSGFKSTAAVKFIDWTEVKYWRFPDEKSQPRFKNEESDADARLVPRQF